MEIGTTKDIMFALTHSNIYVVLPKVQDLSALGSSPILWGTLLLVVLVIYQLSLNVSNINKRICFLNINVDEVIHNLLQNKNNDSLIVVLVYASNNFNSLKCKTIPIEYVSYCILFSFALTISSLDFLCSPPTREIMEVHCFEGSRILKLVCKCNNYFNLCDVLKWESRLIIIT